MIQKEKRRKVTNEITTKLEMLSKKKSNSGTNGITLIALVVTIALNC